MHLLGEYARDDGRGDLLRQSLDGVASRLRRKLLRRHPHAEGLLAHLLNPKRGYPSRCTSCRRSERVGSAFGRVRSAQARRIVRGGQFGATAYFVAALETFEPGGHPSQVSEIPLAGCTEMDRPYPKTGLYAVMGAMGQPGTW
jgi:hypothetical protein